MKLRTYQAFSMAEALAAVKRDLGANAVILNTRTFKRGGVLGLGRKTIIEVTATPSKPHNQPIVETKPPSPRAAAARKAYSVKTPAQPPRTSPPAVTEADQMRTRRLAQAMAAKFDQKQSSTSESSKAVADVPQPSAPVEVVPKQTVQEADDSRPVQRFILASPDASAPTPAPDQRNGVTRDHAGGMQDELSAIKALVGQVLQRQSKSSPGPSPAMPAKLFDYYLRMIAQDVSEELADTIVNEVRDALSRNELDDEKLVRETVLGHLARHIPIAEHPTPSESPDDRPLTIALIGPTGVGKTTTLAKLAATFKLRKNKKVGLITSDTYRIAAVDQLRTYANIIGLPLQVALTPTEMKQAVHSLSECDVILIDTAGRGQNDSVRLAELKELVDAAGAHEVHLVLSSTAHEKVLMREAEAFSKVGINKVVLTKLDEAVNFGMLVNVVRQVGKELSFVTTGQEVPNHIESGRADRIADLVLGGELHT